MILKITIRQATDGDIPRIVEIIRMAFYEVAVRFDLTEDNCPKHPSNCKGSWIEEALDKGARYSLLEVDGLSCGCVALEQANPEVCYLERLGVLPAQQRRGYGRALVDHVIAEARLLGSHQVDIGIIAAHTELKDWYRKIGFVEQKTATFPHLPFEVLFMSKALDNERLRHNVSQ
jgi:N-acetylglutamate synthase-like GNAT family acetyltransferase